MSAVNASTFAPTNQVTDPPNRPEALAEAVLASLSRTEWGYRRRPWGLIKTCILSALTFGAAPLLAWPRRFRYLQAVEEQQMWHLAEWLRLRTGRPEATELQNDARQLGSRSAFPIFPLLLLLSFVFYFPRLMRFDLIRWYQMAYGVFLIPHHHRLVLELWRPPFVNFWAIWSLILCAGYVAHWICVCQHAGSMANFVQRFNVATAAEGVEPIRPVSVGLGFSPLWMIAAVIGLAHGHIWAFPMMLAGVVHWRYVRLAGPRMKGDLAQRVRWMLESSRPVMAVRPTPMPPPTAACPNEKCRAPLPGGGTFCPRCGARLQA
jgi:hypothetical protein